MIKVRFLLILIVFSSCSVKDISSNEKISEIIPVSEGESFNAGFLIVNGVYNSELIAPYDIFQHTVFHTEGGIKVFTVAPEIDTIVTFEGIKIIPDYDFTNVPEIDILIVPSAEHSMDSDLENEKLIAFVKIVGTTADYSISLCDGAFVLAESGLVDGKESTTFPSDIKRYRNMFPDLIVHEDVSFVHDGSLLTSVGGAKSYDVALYLIHHLYGEKVTKGIAKGLVIDWKLTDYKFIRK